MQKLIGIVQQQYIFFILCAILILACVTSKLAITHACAALLCFQLATQKAPIKRLQIIILIVLVLWL